MTINEAITAKLRPYTLESDTIEVLLLEQDLDGTDDYDVQENGTALKKAELAALWQLVTLTKESDGGSTQEYDITLLQERIARLQRELGEESKTTINEDITEYW